MLLVGGGAEAWNPTLYFILTPDTWNLYRSMDDSDGKATELWPGPEDQGFYTGLKLLYRQDYVFFPELSDILSNDLMSKCGSPA